MSAPAPLTPANCDLRDFSRMMIDISRLRQSDFDAITDDSAWRAGVNLWFSAWHSVPAGSLADDEAGLAKAAGLGRDLRTWRKIRTDALNGFVACSDGRLYHRTVCEFALEAWIEKLVQRISSGAGNAKRWGSEFNPTPIEEEIDHVVALLSALNPDSKSIPKACRRHSRPDPAGKEKLSHRDKDSVPSGSLEKGTGKGIDKEEPPLPPKPAQLPAAVRAVMEAGGFVSPPPDLGLLRQWEAAGADLELDVLPVVRAVSRSVREKSGRAPFKLQLFDQPVREKLANDQAEIERLEATARRLNAAAGGA